MFSYYLAYLTESILRKLYEEIFKYYLSHVTFNFKILVLIHKMKVTFQIITTEGCQLILNNTMLTQNALRALVLIVRTSLQDTQENPFHHLIVMLGIFLIFDLFIPEG